jgi:hypothetical protein
VSGVKKNVVSEVMKYDVCVKYDYFSDTTPGHNFKNLGDDIS